MRCGASTWRGSCAATRDPLPVSVWEDGCSWRGAALGGLLVIAAGGESALESLLREHGGPFLRGRTLSYLDMGLLGQFQCMLGNLSDEVLQYIDRCPALWEWRRCMRYPTVCRWSCRLSSP